MGRYGLKSVGAQSTGALLLEHTSDNWETINRLMHRGRVTVRDYSRLIVGSL